VHLTVIAAVFPIILLGELPDKTMFAALVLASRGRPLQVWIGTSAAFLVHVAIAVSIGEVLFVLVPHRALEVIVAVLFAAGAVYSWHQRDEEEETASVGAARSGLRTVTTAFGVIFVAEWGDLTQILTANLAARYHSALSVGLGAVVALWLVAAIAVVAGSNLLKVLSVRTLRIVTAVVLTGLAVYSAVLAATAG
jgi:putative Ca2+/H+ antiporter (TMEM165/GDT1 family)